MPFLANECSTIVPIPNRRGLGCRRFPALGTSCMISGDWHRLHVFPRSAPVTWFPALGTGYMIFRAWHRLHVFPHLASVPWFPVLGSSCICRAWCRFHVFVPNFWLAHCVLCIFVVFAWDGILCSVFIFTSGQSPGVKLNWKTSSCVFMLLKPVHIPLVSRCQPGTYFDIFLRHCVNCSRGTYQPNKSENFCFRCPGNKTTLCSGASDILQCRGNYLTFLTIWMSQ